jgi:hypothetical protein
MNFSTRIKGAILFFAATAFLVLPVGVNSHAVPQSPPHINVSGSVPKTKLLRGRSFRATVVMDIPGGYHVNSNRPLEKFLIPTELKVEAPDGIQVGPVSYPRAVVRKFKFSKSNVSVYEGRAIMRFNVTVPAGTSTGSKELKLRVRYQSCNDEVCFPPQTKDLSLWPYLE